MATKDAFVARVLDILLVTASGQPIAAEDYNTVANRMAPTFESLRARRYAPQIDPENIPDGLFEDLALCVAMRCADQFGVPYDEGRMIAAEQRLRTSIADQPAYGPIQTMYF